MTEIPEISLNKSGTIDSNPKSISRIFLRNNDLKNKKDISGNS